MPRERSMSGALRLGQVIGNDGMPMSGYDCGRNKKQALGGGAVISKTRSTG